MLARFALALAARRRCRRPRPRQTVDVRAGRLIDPAADESSTDQRIRIVDGKIASVAPWRDSDGPASGRLVGLDRAARA